MRKYFTLLFTSVSCFAVTNYNIAIYKNSPSNYSVSAITEAPGGIQDPTLVWVSQNSSGSTEDGSMGAPFKSFSLNCITSSYGKTMVVCPGKYIVNDVIELTSTKLTITSLSGDPKNTWLINPSVAHPMFIVHVPSTLYLDGLKITSSNDISASFWEGGAIFSDHKSLTEVVNCVFDACYMMDPLDVFYSTFVGSIAKGCTFRNCRFYNCYNDTRGIGSIGFSDLYDCEMTNCTGVVDGFGGPLVDSSVYRSKFSDSDSMYYCVGNQADFTMFDVYMQRYKVSSGMPAIMFPPAVMMNCRFENCHSPNGTVQFADYGMSNSIMFGCSFLNSTYAITDSSLSMNPLDTNGVSGVQFCNFFETNAIRNSGAYGNMIGCTTNGIFEPNVFFGD